MLSIIIPVHNEEQFVEKILEKVFSMPLKEKEVIVVNDGSSDKTPEILQKLSKMNSFKLLSHKKNLGKGAAIKTALSAVTGNLVIIQDADLEYNPDDIPTLLAQIDNTVAAVYGKRPVLARPDMNYHYALGAKILTWTIDTLYGTDLADVYTGYKLFNLDNLGMGFLKELESTGFEFEAEVTCKILSRGDVIVEVPIQYIPRKKSQGKHIRFTDAIKGVFTILKCRLNSL